MKRTFKGTIKAGLVAGAIVAMSFGAQSLFAADSGFEFHAYARGGIEMAPGQAVTGGQVDEHWLGRLGNEGNQNYLESELVHSNTNSDGSWAKYHIMFVFDSNGFNGTGAFNSYPGSYGGAVGNVLMRQAYVEMGGFSWDPKATYWIGEKYTGRDDVHILDFFWRNYSGEGFGVTNAFNGMVDLSVTSYDPASTYGSETYIPFQTDLRIRPFGALGVTALAGLELEGAVSYDPGSVLTPDKSYFVSSEVGPYGFQAAAIYNFDRFFYVADGFSKIAVQFGTGNSATSWNLGGAQNTNSYETNAWALRVMAFGQATNLAPNFDMMPVVRYEVVNSNVTQNGVNEDVAAKLGLAVRPVYKFTSNLSLQAELGWAHVFSSNSNSSYAGNAAKTTADDYKITVAPTLSLDSGFWGRPQLRFFYTFVGGAEYVNGANQNVTYDANGTATSESRMGFQFETWF